MKGSGLEQELTEFYGHALERCIEGSSLVGHPHKEIFT
jgi:hypothetical protein